MADGKILSVAQVKNYANIEHDGDDELVGDLIEEAEARLQGYIRIPIESSAYTEYHDGGTSILFLERWPLDASTVVVTDTQGTEGAGDDETVDSDRYRVDASRGEVMRTSISGQRQTWAGGRRRFKVAYEGGLEKHEHWDDFVEAELRASLRDLVVEWYYNRSPGASSEREGAGIGRNTGPESREIPARVRAVWDHYTVPM